MERLRVPAALAVVAIALCGLLVAASLWTAHEIAATPAPTHVAVTPEGELAILVGNRLFIGREQLRAIVDLAPMGADTDPGGIHFLPSGELLLHQRQATPWWHRWRLPSGNNVAPGNGSLARCDLPVHTCRAFAPNVALPDAPLWFENDPHDEILYLSSPEAWYIAAIDGTGHVTPLQDQTPFVEATLHRQGGMLLDPHLDTRFPLPLTIAEEGDPSLETIHTRHHREGSNVIWILRAVQTDAARWVLTKGEGMRGGPVLRLERNGNRLSMLELPQRSDPVDLTLYDDQIVVVDAGLRRVARFDLDGHRLPDLNWPELDARLSQARERAETLNERAEKIPLGFVVLMLGLMVWGARQATHGRGNEASTSNREGAPAPGRNRVLWVAVATLAGLVVVAGLLLLAVQDLHIEIMSPLGVAMGLVLLLGLLLFAWMTTLQGTPSRPPTPAPQQPAPLPDLDDPNIAWIQTNPTVQRLRETLLVTLLLAAAGLPWLWRHFIGDPMPDETNAFLMLSLTGALMPFFLGNRHRHRIGIKGNTILLDQGKKNAASPLRQLRFNGSSIQVDNLHTQLGQYNAHDIDRHLRPKLSLAIWVPYWELQKLWWRDEGLWLTVGLIVVVIAGIKLI